jgi:hypothetical protein
MTLPVSGEISLAHINTEFGLSATLTRSLNDATTRALFGKASGEISLLDGRGKSNAYPGQILTFDGQSLSSPRVTLSGSTGFSAAVAGSTAIVGGRISELHIICWGAGGAGSTWPSSAAGGNGGAGYRASWLRSSGGAVAAFLDSIATLTGAAGNGGTSYGSGIADNRQAGGAGGTSYVNINGTRIVTAKGGNGSRNIYNNGDANYVYPTVTSYVGDNGGAGAPESSSGGSAATYGGGGGASSPSASFGASTYGGRGGSRANGGAPGYAPGGGGGGYDTGSGGNYPRGGIGRVTIYINTPAPF